MGGTGRDELDVRRESWRLMGRLISRNRRLLTVGLLGGIGWQAAGIVVPVVIGWTVDHGIEAGDRSAIWWGGLVLVLLGALEAVGSVVRHRMASAAYMSGAAELRTALTAAALDLDEDGRDAFPPGEVIARETSDTETLGGLLDAFAYTVAETLSIPVIIVLLALVDPVLAVVVGIIVPVSAFITWRYSVVWERRSAEVQESMGGTVERAREAVDGFKVVRGLGVEPAVVGRFAGRSVELRDRSTGVAKLWLIFEPLLEALSVLSVGAVLWIGGERVIAGDVELGAVVTAVGFVLFLSGPVRTVGVRILSLQAGLASAARVVRFLHAPAPVETGGADPAGTEQSVELVADRLVVGRRGPASAVLLRGDLVVPAGSTLLLRGATGSGKSTLLAVLAGLRAPAGGQVLLGGVDVADWPTDALRRRVLLCGPAPFLFAGSIRDNVRFAAPDVNPEQVAAALAATRCSEFVDVMEAGADTIVGERGVTLSGGQRQRLALARAVLARPSILLLDGATSALDQPTEVAVVAGLRAALAGTSLVVVSTNPGLAPAATAVVDIDAGVLQAS